MELSLMRGDVDPDRGRYDFPVLTARFLLVESISAALREKMLRAGLPI